jgi:polar amino acid transport system substrate-binding protein
MRSTHLRHVLVAAAAGAALLMTACGSDGATQAAGSRSGAKESAIPALTVNATIRAVLPKKYQDGGVLIVGTPQNNAPVINKNAAGGALEGIAPDVATALGQVLGVKFEFRDVQFPGVIPGLQSHKFDVSMGFLADTKKRQEVLTFADLIVNKSGFIVKKGNPTNFTDLPDACGHKLGGLQGGQQVAKMQAADAACRSAGKPGVEVKQYTSPSDALAQVQSGAIDSYMGPKLALQNTAETAGGGNVFAVLPPAYPDNPFGIAMAKDNVGLDQAILAAMKELKNNGTYDLILKKYGAEEYALRPDQVVINGAGTPAFTG